MIVVKNSSANAGDIRDPDLTLRSGRSPGGGYGNPLHLSCLGNPIDRGAWRSAVHRVTKNPTQLKRFSFVVVVSNSFWPHDCSMPGSSVLHYLLNFAQIHVYWVGDAFSSSVATFSFRLQSLQASGSFPVTQLFVSSGQSIRDSASAPVLPTNM